MLAGIEAIEMRLLATLLEAMQMGGMRLSMLLEGIKVINGAASDIQFDSDTESDSRLYFPTF